MSAGLFGKLPAHGDFVARGDPALVAWFEDWLTRGLAGLSADHGSLDALLAKAPVWRFAVRYAGGAVAGALIPSRDSVRRLFPLLLFATCDEAEALALAKGVMAVPLDETTTADEAAAMVGRADALAYEDQPTWTRWDIWLSEAGDEIVSEALPAGDDFARLFTPLAVA